MNDYKLTLELLGLPDQNLPVFKEARVNRLKSIDKILNMINVSKRLVPTIPQQAFKLDSADPEWDDQMLYPRLDHWATLKQIGAWLAVSGFFAYNWNVICGNKKFPKQKKYNLIQPNLTYNLQFVHMYQVLSASGEEE